MDALSRNHLILMQAARESKGKAVPRLRFRNKLIRPAFSRKMAFGHEPPTHPGPDAMTPGSAEIEVATPPARDAAGLQAELRRRSGGPLALVLTDNRSSMASWTRRGGTTVLRLHRMFLAAPDDVLDAVAGYAAGKPEYRAALRDFLRRERGGRTRAPAPSAEDWSLSPEEAVGGTVEPPTGRVYDLHALWRSLNDAYLDGRSRARVTWGTRGGRGRTRSIRFAFFDPARRRIVMNRRLDDPGVPRCFVEYVLFHEMLHEVLGIGTRPDGRRDIHGRLFRLMEQTYPFLPQALAFEKEFIRTRLTSFK
jgi:hypothetical protein